jgi:hypothetical protein
MITSILVLFVHADGLYGAGGLKAGQTDYQTSLGVADNLTLAQTLQSITQRVDWTQAVYAGMVFNNKAKADLEALIDGYASSADWLDVLQWSAISEKLGVERESAIEAALDGLPMVGPLPWTINYSGVGYFCVERKFALLGYSYAEKYRYRLDKWNITSAYAFFEKAVQDAGHPVLFVDSNGGTWTISYGPRYYDESASTLQCFLIFYEMGITSALDDALQWWNWINNNLWYQGTHYKYAVSWPDYECEAGFFAKTIANLKYYVSDLGNWSRVLADVQNRFLTDGWNSPQWLDASGTTYVVVHDYPDNPETRLVNTIGAWTSLLGLYGALDSSSENSMQNLLEGQSGPDPAWKLLMSATADLYDNITGKFKWASDDLFASDQATAYALTLMFFMGIVPKTATLAFPLEDYTIDDLYDIDPELFNINLENASIRVSVVNGGQLEFIYGTSPVLCDFPSSGVYELTFSNDWNSLVNVSKIENLPNERRFLFAAPGLVNVQVAKITIYRHMVGQWLTFPIDVTTVENQGSGPETFNVTLYANSTAVDAQTVTLAGGGSKTVFLVWNTSGSPMGGYNISACASSVPNETKTVDSSLSGGMIYVSMPGDLNGDGVVNILDAIILSNAFLATPGSLNWNPNADLNGDDVVNILDCIIFAEYFMTVSP